MTNLRKGVAVTVPHPVTGVPVKGTNLPIVEANAPASEFKLSDGTTLRVTLALLSAVRFDGEIGPDGKPMMSLNFAPTIENLGVQNEKK